MTIREDTTLMPMLGRFLSTFTGVEITRETVAAAVEKVKADKDRERERIQKIRSVLRDLHEATCPTRICSRLGGLVIERAGRVAYAYTFRTR